MAKEFDLKTLAKEMKDAASWIALLPDSHEYTQDELADMEEARQAALMLTAEVETAIETFEGR